MHRDYVRKRLDYDPDTGVFTWKPRPGDKKWNAKHVGEVAGSIASGGYRQIMVDRKNYMAARLAWLYVHGEWPKNHIDHINRIRTDDRLVNLRDVTPVVNSNNRSDNNGLPEGVFWDTKKVKYIAQIPKCIPVFGMTYLGQYGNPIIAGEVVQKGIGIICDNEDNETINILLKELKDTHTEILSEDERRKSGLPKGVRKNGNGFAAQIWRNGRYVHLGTFDTPEEASTVYQQSEVNQ
jgi:hypothetical protein